MIWKTAKEDKFLPIRKDDIRNNINLRFEGLRPHEEEQRIANAILKDRIEFKDTPLSRMTGLKTYVTYYQQKAIGKNNYLVNIDTIGTTDAVKLLTIKINNFIILCQGETSTQVEPKEIGLDLTSDGQAKILPKTIQPMIGDYFIMDVYNKPILFRVSNVNKTTLEDDTAYEITYVLVEENPEEKLKEIESHVSDTYQFIYSHVGTNFRTLFRLDEYEGLSKLDDMYRRLGSLFNEYFYDRDKNTYILLYDTLDLKDETPYVTAKESMYGEALTPPSLNFSDSWYNSKMYDRMLVEFMNRNRIFDYVDKHIFRVTQLRTDVERWYTRTLFYAIENRTNARIAFKYLLPSPITRVNIATSLNLYGIVSLEPVAEKILDSLDLYPPRLLSYILWEAKERSIEDYKLNVYEDVLEFVCETIGLYVNRKDENILSRLLVIHQYINTLFDLSDCKHHLFYIFPLLAYVIREAMDRLSDGEYKINQF
jgi:hypothetical protein